MTTETVADDGAHIADLASSAGLTVAVAESLTSGAIASALGAAPGAADWFAGGVVAYSEQVKFDVLGVTPGPVITASCAEEMASGVGRLLGAGMVVSVTGAGGPGPEEGHDAGTVFLAHGRPDSLHVDELHFDGDPEQVVHATVDAALRALAGDLEEARR